MRAELRLNEINMAESDWDETIVLDRAHLAGFTGGDPSFEAQVLAIFLENAPSYLDALYQSDGENWKTTAHKLKGAARSIGAWRLARAAERAEKMKAPLVGDARREPVFKELRSRLAALIATIRSITESAG
jgi:HPt (histidine-containing phosphotransfer) domain-containing protein